MEQEFTEYGVMQSHIILLNRNLLELVHKYGNKPNIFRKFIYKRKVTKACNDTFNQILSELKEMTHSINAANIIDMGLTIKYAKSIGATICDYGARSFSNSIIPSSDTEKVIAGTLKLTVPVNDGNIDHYSIEVNAYWNAENPDETASNISVNKKIITVNKRNTDSVSEYRSNYTGCRLSIDDDEKNGIDIGIIRNTFIIWSAHVCDMIKEVYHGKYPKS